MTKWVTSRALLHLPLPGPLAQFRGPRFGVPGLRNLLGVAEGLPLLMTALKPMGTPTAQLADMAYRFARGGIDIIKDDHGLSNQPDSPFEARFLSCWVNWGGAGGWALPKVESSLPMYARFVACVLPAAVFARLLAKCAFRRDLSPVSPLAAPRNASRRARPPSPAPTPRPVARSSTRRASTGPRTWSWSARASPRRPAPARCSRFLA